MVEHLLSFVRCFALLVGEHVSQHPCRSLIGTVALIGLASAAFKFKSSGY